MVENAPQAGEGGATRAEGLAGFLGEDGAQGPFEVWDDTAGNLLGTYDTELAALRALGKLARLRGPESHAMREVSLRRHAGPDAAEIVAVGPELAARAIAVSSP